MTPQTSPRAVAHPSSTAVSSPNLASRPPQYAQTGISLARDSTMFAVPSALASSTTTISKSTDQPLCNAAAARRRVSAITAASLNVGMTTEIINRSWGAGNLGLRNNKAVKVMLR